MFFTLTFYHDVSENRLGAIAIIYSDVCCFYTKPSVGMQ